MADPGDEREVARGRRCSPASTHTSSGRPSLPGPYWRGAILALELTLASLGAASVIGFFLALGAVSGSAG